MLFLLSFFGARAHPAILVVAQSTLKGFGADICKLQGCATNNFPVFLGKPVDTTRRPASFRFLAVDKFAVFLVDPRSTAGLFAHDHRPVPSLEPPPLSLDNPRQFRPTSANGYLHVAACSPRVEIADSSFLPWVVASR